MSTPAKRLTMPAAKDAIALLEADHEAVSQLFEEYQRTRSVSNKKALVAEICSTLSVHMQVEEEIFYPAVKSAVKGHWLVQEAAASHARVRGLIEQLKDADHDGERYDAKVQVLSEHVKHHVREEQTEMFPKAMASSLDMIELGARMTARQHDLLVHPSSNQRKTS